MDSIKLYARAKINPALDVLEKLDNGYHSLNTIMQSVSLCDKIAISKVTKSNDIKLYTNIKWLPIDNRNLVYKVAQYLKGKYKIKDGMYISLYKNIPVSAGLAGGSSDCGAALIGIRNLFKLPISNTELLNIGKDFGADIPFCIKRGTCVATGIGERLRPIAPFPYCYIIIVKPSINISTGSIFNNLDLSKITKRPDIERIAYYIRKKDIKNMCNNMVNVLEEVTINMYPLIAKIKKELITLGALGSLMSGSGSSVFGIFLSKKSAVIASRKIKTKFNIKEIFITVPFNNYNI